MKQGYSLKMLRDEGMGGMRRRKSKFKMERGGWIEWVVECSRIPAWSPGSC